MDRSQEREFEEFVAGSGGRLLRTAVLLVGDRQHAEDLVQTALERTARRWTRLEGSPEAYARVVLTHLAVDRRRRRSVVEVPFELDVAGGADAGQRVVDQRTLIAGLRQLPLRQRAAVVLRYMEDMSEAQAAEALGVSIGAVKSATSRGLDRLRADLTETAGEAG